GGSALLLLHHDGLWSALDGWVQRLSPESFVEMLPLVRRGFARFGAAERRAMGERVKRMAHREAKRDASLAEKGEEIDAARGALVFPVLSKILGVAIHGQ